MIDSTTTEAKESTMSAMTDYTAMHHNALIQWAGAGFTWNAAPMGTSRPNSDTRRGFKAHLMAQQNGECGFIHPAHVVCEGELEFCHIVSGGKNRKGWVIAKGYGLSGLMGCRAINEYHRDHIGDIVPLSMIAKPELILGADILTKSEYEEIGMRIAQGMAVNRVVGGIPITL